MITIENKELLSYKSKLKRMRISRGLTQLELSELSGVNIKSISLYEQYPVKINKASIETISLLSDSLGCNIEDLIETKYMVAV